MGSKRCCEVAEVRLIDAGEDLHGEDKVSRVDYFCPGSLETSACQTPEVQRWTSGQTAIATSCCCDGEYFSCAKTDSTLRQPYDMVAFFFVVTTEGQA